MAEKNRSNQQKENQQKVTNQKEALQQRGNDTRDQHIKNDEDNGRIRSERQSLKDAEKKQSRH
jgi:hypothetical protein